MSDGGLSSREGSVAKRQRKPPTRRLVVTHSGYGKVDGREAKEADHKLNRLQKVTSFLIKYKKNVVNLSLYNFK